MQEEEEQQQLSNFKDRRGNLAVKNIENSERYPPIGVIRFLTDDSQ